MVNEEDLIMKNVMANFASVMFDFFNIDETILESAPTEIVKIRSTILQMDFVCKTVSGKFINFEFESTSLRGDDFRRFLDYVTALHRKTKCFVETYIICSANVKNMDVAYQFSKNNFFISHIICLKNMDSEEKINNIKNKIKHEDKLNLNDLTELVLSPIMATKDGPDDQIKKIAIELSKIKIQNTEVSAYEFLNLMNMFCLFSEKFVKNESNRAKILGLIQMQKSMFQLSREKGIEEGKLEGIELMKTVKSLLSENFSVEEVMEKTGLSKKDVESMK